MKTFGSIYRKLVLSKFKGYNFKVIGHDELDDIVINDISINDSKSFYFFDYNYLLCVSLIYLYGKFYLCDLYGLLTYDKDTWAEEENQYVYASFQDDSYLYICEYNFGERNVYIYNDKKRLIRSPKLLNNKNIDNTFMKIESYIALERLE